MEVGQAQIGAVAPKEIYVVSTVHLRCDRQLLLDRKSERIMEQI
jgi:hypothetical protein